MTSMADILAMAAQSRGRDRDDDDEMAAPKPLPEAVIAELRSDYARYGKNPFKPGDLVTPIKGRNNRGAGEPHIVLEVLDTPVYTFAQADNPTATCSSSYGRRIDMRALCHVQGSYVPFWFESWEFEPYTGEGA